MSTAVNCPNCEAPIGGHFCANCGQEAILHHASTREFLHEFIGHYVALEGKLWGSLTRLLFRPGLLTNEYIRGRRVRFVQPLRLYLSLSILFFALLKFTGSFDPHTGDVDADKITAETTGATRQIAKAQARLSGKPLTPDEARGKAAAEAAIAEMKKDIDAEDAAVKRAAPKEAPAPAPEAVKKWTNKDGDVNLSNDDVDSWLADWPTLRHQWHAFQALPNDQQMKVFKDGFYHYAPYAIFCMMPVFAMFLKVLYLGSGRRFGEHVLFALHTNAFAFFMFGVMVLVPFTFVRLLLWCWVLGYLPWAMRRVYHSGRFTTFLRWSALMLAYVMALGLAVLVSMGMGLMTIGH
ncbi:DUF3667 domain-containing protein [Duganella aceris]|uniref:DUF3667 domain-containing protein n=1 Tax=Duganella aceris TaxID=2703883 RepID=A0ABX0FQW9_9BURK|nr:DUF3667 domain-containing protein [Duganella aceris]NGZ86863.1 DUF3667 domain-containing protein [Duganella aceris]